MISTEHPLGGALEDPRLARCRQLWGEFLARCSVTDKFTVVNHGDLDGAIGGAYAGAALQHAFPSANVLHYWVGTDEYDFLSLRQWMADRSPDQCAILDISIANDLAAVGDIAAHVGHRVFIYDHHILNNPTATFPENVILANPTPSPLRDQARHVPTFLFALSLARQNGLHFPDWLLALAIFTEGVEQGFSAELELLTASLPEMLGAGTLRERYRASTLARLATLVRAGYSRSAKEDSVLRLLSAVAGGAFTELKEFHAELEAKFAGEADAIQTAIDRQVALWTDVIAAKHSDLLLVTIPVDGPHAVAGPVTSILRGRYPEKVIMGWIASGERCIIELRTGNDSALNFVGLLRTVGAHVPLLTFGGHPTAAGATVRHPDLRPFLDVFARELAREVQAAARRG